MASRQVAQLCWDRWERVLGVARWSGTSGKRMESMKLQQDNGNEICIKISFESLGITALCPRRGIGIHFLDIRRGSRALKASRSLSPALLWKACGPPQPFQILGPIFEPVQVIGDFDDCLCLFSA